MVKIKVHMFPLFWSSWSLGASCKGFGIFYSGFGSFGSLFEVFSWHFVCPWPFPLFCCIFQLGYNTNPVEPTSYQLWWMDHYEFAYLHGLVLIRCSFCFFLIGKGSCLGKMDVSIGIILQIDMQLFLMEMLLSSNFSWWKYLVQTG